MTARHELEIESSTGAVNLTPERKICTVADAIGSISKLATLAVLDQTPTEFVSRLEMCRRLDRSQGKYPGRRFTAEESKSVPYGYCQPLFRGLGLVEIGQTAGERDPVWAARITPSGSELWPAVAGAYLPWQQANPQLALADVIGSPQQAIRTGSSTRIRILELLLDRPGGLASIADIKQGLALSHGTASATTSELCRIGLLNYRSKHRPEERMFKLSDSTEMVDRYMTRMSDEVRVAVSALLAARRSDGLVEVDGLTIIEMTKQLAPELEPKLVWELFLDWVKNHRTSDHPFVEEVPFSDSRSRRTLLSIAAEHQEPLADFMERRNQLTTDPDFRLTVAAIGRSALASKSYLAKSLRQADTNSQRQRIDVVEWENMMLEYIPTDGIDLESLYAIIQAKAGTNISRRSFRKRLIKMTDLLEFSTVADANHINTVSNVRLKQQVYPSDWYDNARCKTLKLDPEMFAPSESDPIVVRRAKTAAAIFHCLKCTVRRPCLKTAVENGEPTGIWGALTADQLNSLTDNQKDKLLATVKIE